MDPSIQILRDPLISAGSRQLRPDLVLTKDSENVVVELKRTGLTKRRLEMAQDQVLMYLIAGD